MEGSVGFSRLTSLAQIGGIALVFAVVNSCSEPLSPVAQRHGLRVGAPERNYEDCPPGSEMPGGWCMDEWDVLETAIANIRGDSTCDLMRNTLWGWLWNGTIIKVTDFDVGHGAETYWASNYPFDRHTMTQLNASVPEGGYEQLTGVRPGQVLRHEYGHVFYNSSDEPMIYNQIQYGVDPV
jgi:hypothetical protein